ncbi:MAG: restriction endonuclease subunit S [Desulfobulbus sp.]|nr:restriction endonuclease subunit S [Desulfobulbus sp.]
MCAISGKTDDELDRLPAEQFAQLRDTAALFPDELVESKLGMIPKGWDWKRIEDILELAYGKALNKAARKPGPIPVYGSGGINGFHDKLLVKGPGIIVGRKGTVGSLYWENDDFFPIDTVFFVVPKREVSKEYIFLLLQTLGLEKMNTDAAVPGLNRNNVYRLETLGHPPDIIIAFSRIVESIFDKITENKKENEILTQLRDTLLPKLLSGEISVDQAGEDVKEAI